MMLVAYGIGLIACLFVLASMGQLIIQHLRDNCLKCLWKDGYFWLALALFLVTLGIGEWGFMRVKQTLEGKILYAQDPNLAMFVVITLIAGINAAVRAVAIQHPVRGSWYIAACAGWVAFSLAWYA